jgi:hypothetical protein
MMIDRYVFLASAPSGLEATGLGLSTGNAAMDRRVPVFEIDR